MTIHLITKNQGKIKAAKSVFDKYGIELKHIEKEYPEIQADTSLEIARFTAIQAAQECNLPVIREDHSLFIHALGIPGPYTSYVEKKIPATKLLSLLKNEEDRTGHFEIGTVYAEPSGTVQEFVFQVPVYLKEAEIVKDPRGGWNGLLSFDKESKSFVEYHEDERLDVWNKNYQAIAEFLISRQG